ncbi:helix-turn-helix domain-containing protein [Asanoa sp. WMMD1127]|uniref:helix-turn-helix domain-containing protein n=1 Tax=Asanoa sp. WMMD1127 TaxID=3016107 RepID=UPI002415E6B6|nr:helix-turn-helix domain-containing protein [Asanoa sp. WMMD1127]MDG4826533.1 helix-turn-helix domain-containing protein [Asanoa sp. WMMD1127]
MSPHESRAPRTGGVIWRRTVPAARQARILPDGCTDLIWSSRTGLVIAGPDTTAALATLTAGERIVGLRFPPGTGPAVYGVPAAALTDQRVRLDAVWPAATVREIEERMGGDDPGDLLDRVAAARLAAVGGPDRRAGAITAALAAGRTVGETAAGLGLTERHLHRASRDLFGYGPKTLARILRLRRALALLRAGAPKATAAADAGYADQPHLSRDVRALAGVTLSDLVD